MTTVPEWKTLSPSTDLIVHPECEARGVCRDTRVSGARGFLLRVVASGQLGPIAAGRTAEITRARAVDERAQFLRGGLPRPPEGALLLKEPAPHTAAIANSSS